MKHAIISLFTCFAVLLTSCGKAVTTSSSQPGRSPASAPGPAPASLPVPGHTAPPADFAPFEKEPQIIKSVRAIYPEEARKAGLEGKVWVKIWIDKTGKPKQVVIQKSAAEIFDQAAIDAVMQFVFTPAVLNGAPIDVWVSIPFDFKLK
jgi:protein TonB